MTQAQFDRVGGVAACAFLAVSIALGVANARFERDQRAKAEGERRASTEQILAQARVAERGARRR